MAHLAHLSGTFQIVPERPHTFNDKPILLWNATGMLMVSDMPEGCFEAASDSSVHYMKWWDFWAEDYREGGNA